MYSDAHDAHGRKTGNYYWEVSLFEISNWKLQYRMKTSSFPASQVRTKVSGYSKLITRDLVAKKKIHPLPKRLKPF
jgi:hypothetical protein